MRSVAKSLPLHLADGAIYLINLATSTHDVVLGDEDDIRIAQRADVPAGLERVRVHQRGIVPRAPRLRALVGALYLDVVFPALRIPGEHVEPDAAPLEALDRILRLRLYDLQVLFAQNDLQHQLDAFRRVLKALRHEVLVHEPEALDLREILRFHNRCRTPRPRLADDGLSRFLPSRLNTFRHISSYPHHSPENNDILPYFRTLVSGRNLWGPRETQPYPAELCRPF